MKQITITRGAVRTSPLGEKNWEGLSVAVPTSLYATIAEEAEKLGVSKGMVVRAALDIVFSSEELRAQLRARVLSQPLILKRMVMKKVIVDG